MKWEILGIISIAIMFGVAVASDNVPLAILAAVGVMKAL